MIEITVDSINAYVEEILNIHTTWKKPSGYLWCRGIGDITHKLVPGIGWRNVKDETTLTTEFLINYKQLLDKPYDDAWDLYYLMQHYGLPTRLLDWTKSPLNALFFALCSHKVVIPEIVVWIIQPEKLNLIPLGEESIITPYKNTIRGSIVVNNYLPQKLRGTSDPIPELPIAIEPVLANKRIISQQGCFTIHGINENPIDFFYNDPRIQDYLVKVKFLIKSSANDLMAQLRALGIKEELIWQDLNQLSTRIISEEVWKH